MSTINISLPKEQVILIDTFTSKFGFANRSEFIRSLIRLATQKPSIVEDASVFPFSSPKEKSVQKIVMDFSKTQKYSKKFLTDLEEGLSQSNYFTK